MQSGSAKSKSVARKQPIKKSAGVIKNAYQVKVNQMLKLAAKNQL